MIQMKKHSLTTFHLLKSLPYYAYATPSLCCNCSEAENNSSFLVVKDSFDSTGFYVCPIVTSKEETG